MSYKILLVDDLDEMRFLTKGRLERLGYRVVTAEDGREAVEAATREAYDLIIMDLDMPEMDGLEATREIRRVETEDERPRTPILVCSSFLAEVEMQRCRDAGIDDQLPKPPDREILKTKLETWLQES